MREAIHSALQRVWFRLQTQFALRCVIVGLIAGSIGGLAIGLTRLAFDLNVSWTLGAGVMATGPVLGLLVGLIIRRGWHDAASAVDTHYGLKDRAVTALAFAAQPSPTELHTIQINEALGHLSA